MNLKIKKIAGTQWSPAICKVLSTAFSHSTWLQKDIENSLQNESHLWMAAFENEKLIGFLQITQVVDEAEILNLAVDPVWQGKKIGAQLLMEAEIILASQKTNKLFLEVRQSNVPAQKLYQGLGFSEIARRHNYYDQPQEDALILQKYIKEVEDGKKSAKF
ncbi:ribosomal protein S18-alanine N-acetyltransferase [Enterococcus timonensis]|uniref:ribosomal protein S18-alanine N-acetyltransferase n=1 Tax=Enterococcus timonensis TaxID=1852364 RepID=UPI0008DA2817|nr:ribosomal protein S18-alanine N-acetyltransferase [Enterococcus timonensis]